MNTTTRLFSCLAAFLAGATLAQAQFGLDKLDLGKVQKGLDTAKDVSKMAKGLAGIGAKEEHVIGGSVAVEIISRYGGLLRDEAITRRVNLIGRALASYSSRPQLQWCFAVLDSDQINAFSAPSGYVMITRGLYELCETDDQLAAALAHEIAHITQRHALKIVARGEFIAGATSLAARQSSDVRNVQAALDQFDLGVGKIMNTLCEQGFDKATEFDADKRGDELCTLVGYAPGSLHAVLSTVKRSGANQERMFSTHPPLDERLARLPAGARKGQ